jgi:Ca2+-binding RTX toxin-like protein
MGGDDTIDTGNRNDIVIGGTGDDVIRAGNGVNIVVGDNARLFSAPFDALPPASQFPADMPFSVHEFIVCRSRPSASTPTAATTSITGGSGNDIIFGGGGGDT